jgi:hypothetical protein
MILGKLRGVFAKFQGSRNFYEFMNYFSKEKGVNRVYSSMNRVHVAGLRVHRVHLTVAIGYRIGGPDQIGEGLRPGSNLVHQFIDEQP